MPPRSLTRHNAGPWRIALVSGMASYIDAAAITGFASAIVIYREALGLSELQIGLASATLTAAIAVGALVGGRLGDRIGRRPVFTTTMVMIVLAAALLGAAPGFGAVLSGAILLGLGTGADLPVSLATISESAPDRDRGRMLGFSNLLWALGIIGNTALVAGVGDEGRVAAQVIFGHVGIVAAVALLARLGIPESPAWLAAREERRLGVPTIRARRTEIRLLLRAPYAVPFIGLILFYGFSLLVANTNSQYANYIVVEYAHVGLAEVSRVSLMLAPIAMLGYLWFMRIADTPSRFLYFIVGAILGVAAPLVMAFAGISLTSFAVSILLSFGGAAFAFEGIMKVWTQESFPTMLRSTAQGAIVAVARLAAACFAAVTPLLLAAGPQAFYVMLAVLKLIGVVVAVTVFRSRDRHDEFLTELEAHEEPARG